MKRRSKSESGQAMLEFAIVSISLAFMFAGAFTIGAYLTKALQVSNVTRSAAVLMVRSLTDTKADLNLALTQNQAIMVREASGLGLATGSNSTGNSVVILSKIVLVGANECAAGVTPIPTGVPPWSTSTCANYGSYVFAYRVAFGNTTRWTSYFGTPPSSDVQADGTYLASDIATDTSVQVPATTMTSVITLSPSQYALVSETYADVSGISVFSIFKPPVIYYRTIT
jgi:Flp pilus assembly protein TadG